MKKKEKIFPLTIKIIPIVAIHRLKLDSGRQSNSIQLQTQCLILTFL